MRSLLCLFVTTAFFGAIASAAEDHAYPAWFGVIDVTAAPYHADSTGKADSTAALQAALDAGHDRAHPVVFLPAGTYRVSKSLRWQGAPKMGPTLQGIARERVTIRLDDGAADFQDPQKPAGVLWTGSGSADNFCVDIRDLTIDTGRRNPGACGIQYMSNNQGGIRAVTVRSGDGAGVAGLDLSYTDMIGPCLISNVAVEGFAVGLRTGWTVNSVTVDGLTVSGQSVAGVRNTGQCLSLRGLISRNAVPAVINDAGWGFLALVDSTLTGSGAATAVPAIINRAQAYVRGVTTTGYRQALSDEGTGREERSSSVVEYSSTPALSTAPSVPRGLGLTVEETPAIPWGNPATWADVRTFGADPTDQQDDTTAFQKAIDSGAEVLCVPPVGQNQSYRIAGSLELRGKVRWVVSGRSGWDTISAIGDSHEPVFRVTANSRPVVAFTDLTMWDLGGGQSRTLIAHEGPSTVILQSLNTLLVRSSLYSGADGAGKVFFNDVSCQFPNGQHVGDAPNVVIGAKQQAWARQLNLETECAPKLRNRGGQLWVLGYKIERGSTLLEALGGSTEILGGLCYTIWDPAQQPAFRVVDGRASIVMAEAGFHQRFQTVVSETRGGATTELKRDQVPGRCAGFSMPLFVADPPTTGATVPPAPTAFTAQAISPISVALTWKPAAGAIGYRVRRGAPGAPGNGLLGFTAGTTWTDSGLTDGTAFTWTVAAVGRSLGESPTITATARTQADTVAPHATTAVMRPGIARTVVTFSKPLATAGITAGSFHFAPPLAVTGVTVLDGGLAVELSTAAPAKDTSYALTLSGLTDRATVPNQIQRGLLPVTRGKDPVEQLHLTFDQGDLGIGDNSAWRQGKVEATPIEQWAFSGSRAAQLTITTFGQAVLGKTQVNQGRTYVVRAQVMADHERDVTLQFRQWDAPYTTYGTVGFHVGPTPQTVTAQFTGNGYDNDAVLFLVAEGGGTLTLDNLTVSYFDENE